MDRNSEKWSQKCYHSLPFAVKVSVPRSFEQFRSLNWGDKEALRIIQSHHVIKHAVFKQSKGFLTACRNTAAYCIFLPFGTPDSDSKFRRYQVFIRYNWTSASMTKGNRLSKRKQNVLRRDDYFYFHHYSFQICITDQAWGGQYDWIYGALWEMCMQVPNPAILRNILGQESICFTAKFSWFWFTTVCLAVI